MPQDQSRNGQKVSPEALAAFYRHRSESLKDNHTTRKEGSEAMKAEGLKLDNGLRPAAGIFEQVIGALQGHPGYVNK